MYYHARPLKYVEYGKIYGNPNPGEHYDVFYKWLSNYCGYFPQVWMSRSRSTITGIRNDKDAILFGFDVVKGFPLHYNWWEMIMSPIWGACHDGTLDPVRDVEKVNDKILAEARKWYEPWPEDSPDEQAEHLKGMFELLPGDPRKFDSAEEWLWKNVFVKHDQVVVPSLNLKAAKEVFCRSDKERKELRKMGFIEDRIKVRKFPKSWE